MYNKPWDFGFEKYDFFKVENNKLGMRRIGSNFVHTELANAKPDMNLFFWRSQKNTSIEVVMGISKCKFPIPSMMMRGFQA